MLKFLHAADVHLDSPLSGLDSYEGAPVEAIRGATRKAIINLVRLAIDQRVAFVILAGDNYDGDWKDYNTGLFFVNQMQELRKAGIPVVLLAGNHDAESRITSKLTLPDNVLTFPTDNPNTILFEQHRVALHGQGFARQAELRNLATNYPIPKAGWFNIGVLHTSLTGREGHANYAPCTLEELKSRDYDYWALGHVHNGESLNGENRPRIEWPGNIQGRHIRETGAKGCLIVEVDANLRVNPQFHALDVFRWERIQVEAGDLDRIAEVRNRVDEAITDAREKADGRPLAVRIELTLQPAVYAEISRNPEEFRMDLAGFAGRDVWIEKVKLKLAVVRNEPGFDLGEDARSELFAALKAIRENEEEEPFAEGDCGKLKKTLPPELREVLADQSVEIWERATALLQAASGEEVS